MLQTAPAPSFPRHASSRRQTIVLVVEDDPGVQGAIAEVLGSAGYEVELADNGLDALERMGRDEPNVVLLDLMMPSLSGWRFLEECRSRGVHSPVVVLSGIKGLHDYPASLGVEAYLTKPFRTEVLLDTVARLMSGSNTS